ncbi:50S ribosomal protein L11 methyltransferase [Candidatus Latescibacterota bacterium]
MRKKQVSQSSEEAKPMWHSVRCLCEPGFEDVVTSGIFESGFSGLEEQSENGRTLFTAYYPVADHPDSLNLLRQKIEEIGSFSGSVPCKIISVSDVPDEDWETTWREGLDPIEVGARLVIRPSWTTYVNTDDRMEIIIDPKMAFGTGGHPTTRLCLEELEGMKIDGHSVIDAGVGSGVLSIAAVKFGAKSVFGFDHDHFSTENARENTLLNGVDSRITISEGRLETMTPEPADVVFANMISSVLLPNLSRFHDFMKPGGTIVFSGLLATERSVFLEALNTNGFRAGNVLCMEEWISVTATGSEDV